MPLNNPAAFEPALKAALAQAAGEPPADFCSQVMAHWAPSPWFEALLAAAAALLLVLAAGWAWALQGPAEAAALHAAARALGATPEGPSLLAWLALGVGVQAALRRLPRAGRT
jgi:hypothetical protein